MEYGKPFLLNIFTFNDPHGYLVENPIQTLIIRRHIVFLVWFIKRAWAACAPTHPNSLFLGVFPPPVPFSVDNVILENIATSQCCCYMLTWG